MEYAGGESAGGHPRGVQAPAASTALQAPLRRRRCRPSHGPITPQLILGVNRRCNTHAFAPVDSQGNTPGVGIQTVFMTASLQGDRSISLLFISHEKPSMS